MVDQARLLDLGDYVRLIRARRTLVIVVALVFAVGSVAYVVHRGAKYTASSRVLVEPLVNTVTGGAASNADTPNMQTESEILKSVDTANGVRTALGISTPAQTLLKGVRVSVPPDTNVLVVGYVSSSPTTAARLANAFAREYVTQRRDGARNQVLDVVNSLSDTLISDEAQIQASTDPKEKANLATQIKAISSRIGSLEVIAASIEGGRVVQPASVPASPTGPGVVPISLIGLLLGLIVGAAVAVIRGLLSDQIRDQDELSAYLGAPVIGRIPAVPTWHSRDTEQLITAVAPWSPAAEAYRTLATNIRFRGAADSLRHLVVTSALMEEGKSATATNLAVVLAEIGIQTLLVDADLRRSRAGRFLGIESGPGLQEALEGWADVTDLIVPTSVPRLAFLRSGETPVDPVALLSAERADRVFETIVSLADLVICDAPPVLPVADASLLAKRADAVLFVNDPAISSRGALKDAVQQLRTVGTPILGGVYNNITPSRDRYGDRYASPSLVPSAETTEAGSVPSAPSGTLRERRTPMRHTPPAAVETGPDAPSPRP